MLISQALVVDLDRNYVLTSSPPTVLNAGQRQKMITRLTQALSGEVTPSGVPSHLRSAYNGGKLVPAGQIIVMKGEVESVQDPEWWNQDAVMSVMDHVCEKMGRNTGIKALFGGAVKKPLMTKVSLRHLNEIVRERNQYSRDAQEAWQDFINLKGRMDTEIQKVTKRNNFLVEELENWKQQFEKFQTFAAQLTKEAQELKSKIETHKRENRRLSTLIEEHKSDAARLSARLAGTEKDRDQALEALVLQQEIAEDLERERKKNKKEIAALTSKNAEILQQKEQAQRVVLHLRSLIEGQAHHMEHIVRSLAEVPDLEEYAEEVIDHSALASSPSAGTSSPPQSRATSRASTIQGRPLSREDVQPEMETKLYDRSASSSKRSSMRRYSNISVADVADRHLRDKTDAIAHIIRNISAQCAAAVEGLQLAHDAAREAEEKRLSVSTVAASEDGEREERRSYLSPHDGMSSIPPTPDLIHRSSTALSFASTQSPDRTSLQYSDIPTQILEDSEEALVAHETENTETGSLVKGVAGAGSSASGVSGEGAFRGEGNGNGSGSGAKKTENGISRAGARISAFGAA